MSVFDRKRELNEFLEAHPELKERQREIDEMLKHAGSQHNRIVILKMLLQDKLEELQEVLISLTNISK